MRSPRAERPSGPQPPTRPLIRIPFNRVQLAAALIEYNEPDHEEHTSINWAIQEQTANPAPVKNHAPYSAIFIPFRHANPQSTQDFFPGIEIATSPKSYANTLSGFGLVSEPVKTPQAVTPELRTFSQQAVIHQQSQPDIEVLSEWGLDKLLSGNLTTPADENQTARSQENLQPDRQHVKSDLFDFHFSQLRLNNLDDQLDGTPTRDFLADKVKIDDGVIDDEVLLRQRVGCDPEGRKFLRPQSVLELKETRLMYQNPRSRMQSTSNKTKQLALARGRATNLVPQRAGAETKESSVRKKSALRAKSLSPTRLVAPASTATRHRSVSGVPPSSSSIPARARRKSVLDEPFNLKPLRKRIRERTKSVSAILHPSLSGVDIARKKKISTEPEDLTSSISSQLNSSTLNPVDPKKPKRRTSADIAERYQKSIALLEGRKSEDETYDVQASKIESSLGGSQQGKDGQVIPNDNESNPLTRVGSTSNSQSEFSLGAPRQFTSRFDPKISSVLSQVTPSQAGDEQSHAGQSFGDDEDQPKKDDELDDVDHLKPIYDDQGRIRFPMSLKPMVLIMPIPLTPAQPEPEQDPADDVDPTDPEDQAEKAKQEQIQKINQVRPAGKLYGRSLIDELNSRTATQKSRQMAFAANRRTKAFISPEDGSRPESIHSVMEPVPEMHLMVPNSSNSRLHKANHAIRTSQFKFNQALVNSSKARQSVFGIDMVMKGELEKLKKIKELEEQESLEEEAKIEAKEAKKQAKKWGKKKSPLSQDFGKIEQAKGQVDHRLSRLDNWDHVLDRQSKLLESRFPVETQVRESKFLTPLPVLPTPNNSNPNLVSNMDDWFKDRQNESSERHTPVMPSSIGHEDDQSFGNENTLARKLEIQVENVKYTPLPNLFESCRMVRPNSVQSQSAYLSLDAATNTPQLQTNNPLTVAIEEHSEQEEVLDVQEEDDKLPLSYQRKSHLPRLNVDLDEDDNRPLSMIGTKLAPMSARSLDPPLARSPAQLTPSPHDSDEELPLGIRASILISQKHPPIDLTNDGASSEGPIGSNASDESDLAPLGLRASVLPPLSSHNFRPTSAFPIAGHYHPTSLSHSGGSNGMGRMASIRSTGAQSDDVPLGTKLHGVNSSLSSPSPFQTHLHSSICKDTSFKASVPDGDDDDDDDVPIGRRITIAPPPPLLKVAGLRQVHAGTQEVEQIEERSGAAQRLDHRQQRGVMALRGPILSQIIVDETVARQDTLAALEGRGNVDEHTDDDVPLGVTRAAHTTAGGTLQRERTRKRKMARERKQEASKAQAAWESLNAPGAQTDHTAATDLTVGTSEEASDDDVPLGMAAGLQPVHAPAPADEDDDDVPLGVQIRPPTFLPPHAFLGPNPNIGLPNNYLPPAFASYPPQPNLMLNYPLSPADLPLDQSQSNITKWRQDILK